MNKKNYFISNLCWEEKHQESIINIIKKNKIKGIDFAPLQITSNWKGVEKKTIKYSKYLKKNKIIVNAVQGIFFKKKFNLFKDQKNIHKILSHLKIIIRICKILNCNKIILGSTEFRNKFNLRRNEANKIFVNFLNKLLPLLQKEKIFLCLETIPKQYNEKYLYNFNQVLSIIKEVNSKWISINFDTSLFHFKKLNIREFKKNINFIKNIQITQKDFKFLLKPSKKNINFCKMLKNNNKFKDISLEIIESETDIEKVSLSIKNFKRLFS